MLRKEYDNRQDAKLVNPGFTLPEYETRNDIFGGSKRADIMNALNELYKGIANEHRD